MWPCRGCVVSPRVNQSLYMQGYFRGYFISCDYLLEIMKISCRVSSRVSCTTSVRARVLIILVLLPICKFTKFNHCKCLYYVNGIISVGGEVQVNSQGQM